MTFEMKSKVKRELFEWFKTISLSIILALGISLLVQPTVVSGQSMYPTLNDNDLLLVNKLTYEIGSPNRGDIIVFHTELVDEKTNKKKDLIKRVIGLPNEHLVIKDSKIYINGKVLNEEYLDGAYTEGAIDIIIPKNHVFTMGDNRTNSADSRKPYIGSVPLDSIIGKAYIRVYPLNKAQKLD